MKVLIGCEFSGTVREAFLRVMPDCELSIWSCDLMPTEIPGRHLQGDLIHWARDAGWKWDLLIAHPPCTYLARSGARWWPGRQTEQAAAIEFCRTILALPIKHIALENPIGKLSTAIRKPDQIIQPWQFGHPETKATCFWLKNLPNLLPTKVVDGREPRVHFAAPGPDRWKERSRTLPGIAEAMASQWGSAVSAARVAGKGGGKP